ncbi:MAG: hypothetical protein BWK79_08275 [Beggiatoa sp. IS2]|nr:MAG: hypothetical protein BWK79_08275 [Beggiatoa sp. IS2]
MMTIARNLALGLGMSTADGTIPTNGTQPLVTFIWSGFYWLTAGDKIVTLKWIIVVQFLIAALSAVLLWRLGRQIFRERADGHTVTALAVATWYASPVILPHSTNGLETGLYGLAVIGIAWLISQQNQWSWRFSALLGIMLGVTFWIRNDAAFLIFAVCLTHLLRGGNWQRRELWQRFWQVMLIGTLSIVVALPWLIFNKIIFGHIMPISGQAQALTAEFAHNLLTLPPVLVEYLLVILPIPNALQNQLPVVLGCTVILGIVAIALTRYSSRWHAPERQLFVLISIYLLGFCGFYGLYFGASYFIARYFFPISPFFALLWAAVVIGLWRAPWWQPVLRDGVVVLFIAIIIGLSARDYRRGYKHQHLQVVDWVKQNVADNEWVGATQSGTVGYFHDRTLNLDGKVNPEALEARKQDQLIEYVLAKRVSYLADWEGITSWLEKPLVQAHFELVVQDTAHHLGVLKRKTLPIPQ